MAADSVARLRLRVRANERLFCSSGMISTSCRCTRQSFPGSHCQCKISFIARDHERVSLLGGRQSRQGRQRKRRISLSPPFPGGFFFRESPFYILTIFIFKIVCLVYLGHLCFLLRQQKLFPRAFCHRREARVVWLVFWVVLHQRSRYRPLTVHAPFLCGPMFR